MSNLKINKMGGWWNKAWTAVSRAGALTYFGYQAGQGNEVKVTLEQPKPAPVPDNSINKEIYFLIVLVLVALIVLIVILVTRMFYRNKPKKEHIRLRTL